MSAMTSPTRPLVIEDLSFKYRDRQDVAIKNISFDAKPGEILLIAGASGCGKTTLIRCINGLNPRSYKGELYGRILVFGEDVKGWKLAQISQKIGTVLQDPERQILGTKVLNEVAFGLENLGMPREEIIQRVDQALELLKIPHLRDRETFNLSGGEKQKVALAGVLAMRPSILLLDEPLASLDPASAQDALDTVRFLADEGMTVLMVEHRVEDVLRIKPERVMFISGGEICYLGKPSGLSKVVNYHEVKLPAEDIVERAKRDQMPSQISILPSVAGSNGSSDEPGVLKALVKFENVSFGYDSDVEILHGLNLEIKRGDVIAVLGPNGAGKTTFVKHAIGLLKPNNGRVLVDGRDTKDASVAQIASMLGYVFQSPSHMLFAPTVYEELSFGPKNLRHPEERIVQEVREALKIVNLSDKENDPPLALSFGQQKRVSIAAILAMQSRILVMDEPTAGQDYQNYMNFMDSILGLPSFEAILFITHDVDLAVIYANRVLMFNNGMLVADGKPEDVLCDFDRLEANRLVPTSLLSLNIKRLGTTGRFLRAEALAHT
jgi:energy-coupling factor transport system ATP-binding protein